MFTLCLDWISSLLCRDVQRFQACSSMFAHSIPHCIQLGFEQLVHLDTLSITHSPQHSTFTGCLCRVSCSQVHHGSNIKQASGCAAILTWGSVKLTLNLFVLLLYL